MAAPLFHFLELYAGVGMLGEGVRAVLPGARCAGHVEWEAYAAAVLLERMEDAALEPAPVWCGDLRGFDARPFRGVVDLLIGGPPCQPYSCAGKQEGNADERSHGTEGDGPIPQLLRIIGECGPAVVFLENVPAWVRSAEQWFRPVGEALCGMGYALCEPLFVAAADVGAGHERERVFLMAYLPGERCGETRLRRICESAQRIDGSGEELPEAGELAYSDHEGGRDGSRQTVGAEALRHGGNADVRSATAESSGSVADTQRAECEDAQTGGRHAAGGLAGRSGGEVGESECDGCQSLRPAEEGQAGSADPFARAGKQLAHAADGHGTEQLEEPRPEAWRGAEPDHEPGLGSTGRGADAAAGVGLADACGAGLSHAGCPRPSRGPVAELCHEVEYAPLPEGPCERCERDHLAGPPGDVDGGFGLFAPGPSDARWGGIIAHAPQLAPAVEPGLRLLADGLAWVVDPSRTDQLRCTGNGVVPLQAAVAFRQLLSEAFGGGGE